LAQQAAKPRPKLETGALRFTLTVMEGVRVTGLRGLTLMVEPLKSAVAEK
jgi:hypothetical protein